MKWIAIAALGLILFTGIPLLAQQAPGANQNGWICPGGGGWGGGMGRGAGRMANMQQGQGQCPWGGPGAGMGQMGVRARSGEPITYEQASKLLENYVSRTGNANLKPGEIQEKDAVFEATVVTKDGSLVEKIEIDKNTGFFRRAS